MEHEIVTTNGKAHAQSTMATSTSTAQSHPLQDVELNGNSNGNFNENVPVASMDHQQQQQQQQLQQTTKQTKNWVKFEEDDDDDNNVDDALSGSSSSAAVYKDNNTNDNNGNSATQQQQQQQNKLATLSPPPPSVVKSNNTRARSRSPNERQQAVMESAAAAAAAAAAAPMQRTKQTEVAPAVLTTESTHVDLTASGRQQQHQHQLQQQQQQQSQLQQQAQHKNQKLTNLNSSQQQYQQQQQAQNQHNGAPNALKSSTDVAATTSSTGSVTIPVETSGGGGPTMRTIELSTGRIREGFANGDVIVTLLPANTKWPWITPAIFRPELVPEELMAQGLTLTVEDYVNAMETLVNDYRFTVYNICYKRILVCWILFAFAVLLTLLFSGLQGVALFSLGVGWLFLNAAAIFLCMWVKLRLSRGLEKCLARVNKQLMRHKILLVLDDRGRISCHKVNLCFLYFDATQCVNFLNEFLEQTEQNGGEAIKAGWEAKLDIDMNDIVIQGSNPVRLSRKQAVAQELFLSYLQRWGKDFLRRRLDWTVQEAGVHETPRHLQSSICPCQYEEEVLRNKIKIHLQRKQCCGINCLGCWL